MSQEGGAHEEAHEVNCPVCGASERTRLFSVRDYQFPELPGHFVVCRCFRCSAGYLSPRPSKSNIAIHYPADFFWKHEGGAALDPDGLLSARRKQLAAKLALIGDLRPGRLLDIGAMKGEFVYKARELGWQAEGIEFVATPENLFRVPMRYGDFLSLDYQEASFDCITMWAVLEHVYRPREFIQRVARLLRPGGRFVVLVTNFNSPQGRLLRADDYPRHLTLFTKKSLALLLGEHGLAIERTVTDQTIFGGPLHGGLVHLVKVMGGYTHDEVLFERRSDDRIAFCCKWRGQPSAAITWISRIDHLISLPIERLLDASGNGFTLTVTATRR